MNTNESVMHPLSNGTQMKTQRFPKACKTQMFTRTEEVWIRALEAALIGRKDSHAAFNIANFAVKEFRNQFDD